MKHPAHSRSFKNSNSLPSSPWPLHNSTLASTSNRRKGAFPPGMFIKKHSWAGGEQQKQWTYEGGRDPAVHLGNPALSVTAGHLKPTISQEVQVDRSSQKSFWLSMPTGSLFVPLSYSDANFPSSLLGMKILARVLGEVWTDRQTLPPHLTAGLRTGHLLFPKIFITTPYTIKTD